MNHYTDEELQAWHRRQDVVTARNDVHVAKVALELAELAATGAKLAVRPSQARWLAQMESIGFVVDLESGLSLKGVAL